MNRPKQVILYCPGLYPCTFGGMEIYNHNLVQALINNYPEIQWKVLTHCKSLIDGERYLSLKNKLFLTNKYGLGAFSTIMYYSFSKAITWRDTKVLFIPYTSTFYYSSVSFILLKYLASVEYIVHIHGGGMRPWKPIWLQRLFFKKAKKIAGVSWPIVHEYAARSKRQVDYLPPLVPFNKIDKSKEELRKEKGFENFDQIILFVGSLKPLKAPQILIKAIQQIGEDFLKKNKIGVVILGEGVLKSELEEMVKLSKLGSSIHFLGKIPNQSIAEYYTMSDIFVIPSWFEGTPIALLEAMFNGLICIGSNVSGIRDVISDRKTGLLFEKDDFQQLAMILKEVLSDSFDASNMIRDVKKEYHAKYDFKHHLNHIFKYIND